MLSLVLVEVVTLPEAQQVVEVVEQAAGVFLGVLLLPQCVQVEGQLGPPPGQHQDDQTGVETAHVLLQGAVEVGWMVCTRDKSAFRAFCPKVLFYPVGLLYGIHYFYSKLKLQAPLNPTTIWRKMLENFN